MKTSTKILIGFLAIIVLGVIQISVTYTALNHILNNTQQIKDVEIPLELMAQQVIGYDDVFTTQIYGAILDAQKGDYTNLKEYRRKYDEFGVIYDSIVQKDAKILLWQSTRPQSTKDEVAGYIDIINDASTEITYLETEIFEAVEKKDLDMAYSLARGADYKKYKDEIYQNSKIWVELEHSETIRIGDGILKDSQRLIYLNLIIVATSTAVMLIVLLIILSFIVVKDKSYRLLYDTSNDAIMTLKPPNWRFTAGNPATIKLFGLKSEKQFISLTPGDLSPKKQPDDQLSSVKAKKMIEKAMKEGSNFFEWTHKKYKGKDFSANVLLSRVKDSEGTYLQATVRKAR